MLRQVSMREQISYVRPEKLPADQILQEDPGGSPFIKVIRNALVRGTRILESSGVAVLVDWDCSQTESESLEGEDGSLEVGFFYPPASVCNIQSHNSSPNRTVHWGSFCVSPVHINTGSEPQLLKDPHYILIQFNCVIPTKTRWDHCTKGRLYRQMHGSSNYSCCTRCDIFSLTDLAVGMWLLVSGGHFFFF